MMGQRLQEESEIDLPKIAESGIASGTHFWVPQWNNENINTLINIDKSLIYFMSMFMHLYVQVPMHLYCYVPGIVHVCM